MIGMIITIKYLNKKKLSLEGNIFKEEIMNWKKKKSKEL